MSGNKAIGLPLAKSATHSMKSLSPPQKNMHMVSVQPEHPGKHPGPNSAASGSECAGIVTLQSQGKQNREWPLSPSSHSRWAGDSE